MHKYESIKTAGRYNVYKIIKIKPCNTSNS